MQGHPKITSDQQPPADGGPEWIRSKQSTVKARPKRLCIGIGGHFGPGYRVTLEKGRLIYTYWPPRDSSSQEPQPHREEIQPSAKQWHSFRKRLDRIDVWCWHGNYPNSAMVCDGTGWSAEIVYSDRSLVSSGDNCFPGLDGRAIPITAAQADNTFAKFCRASAA